MTSSFNIDYVTVKRSCSSKVGGATTRWLRCSADLSAQGAAPIFLMKFDQWRQRPNFTVPGWTCMHMQWVKKGRFLNINTKIKRTEESEERHVRFPCTRSKIFNVPDREPLMRCSSFKSNFTQLTGLVWPDKLWKDEKQNNCWSILRRSATKCKSQDIQHEKKTKRKNMKLTLCTTQERMISTKAWAP